MDASHDVGSVQRSATALRKEIHVTVEDLHDKLQELGDYAHLRLGTLDNPLHIRDAIVARPFVYCGVAVVVGVVCGALPRRFKRGVVESRAGGLPSKFLAVLGKTVGSHLAAGLADRVGARIMAHGPDNILK